MTERNALYGESKTPLDHIERPRLPWRHGQDAITECGKIAASVRTVTRDTHARRLKELGQQRTAMLTCMTCYQTSERWGSWDQDPREAIQREIDWEGTSKWDRGRGHALHDELRALAALVKLCPTEFDACLHAVRNTVDISVARTRRRMRRGDR